MVHRILGATLLLLMAAGSGSAADSAAVRSSSSAAPVLGRMAGLVTDARGIPQMGAAVALLALDGRVVQRLLTNEQGSFLIEKLKPGSYNLRVTLANFLPVFKEHVMVEAGGQAFLSINLASLSDALERLAGRRRNISESDEDWGWVIRSSGATRPVLRLLPGTGIDAGTVEASRSNEHHARLEFLGGGGRSSSFGSETDFSTGFGYSQALFHGTTLLLGGNVGYQGSAPATAFRSVFQRTRADGTAPELSVTVREVFLPGASLTRALGRTDNLQSIGMGYQDAVNVGRVRLEYGGVYDTISFLDRVNSISSFGRAIVEAGPDSHLILTFNQGIPRQTRPSASDPLREVTSDLSLYPRMSVRNGSPAVQHGRHMEAGFQQALFSGGTLQVSTYRDSISNWAVAATAGDVPIEGGEFLPDALSQDYSYNAGNYRTSGTRVSYQQKFGDNVQAVVAYAYGGVLMSEGHALPSENLESLRDLLRVERRHSLAMKLGAGVPVTHTRVLVSYKWIPGSTPIAADIYDQTAGAADPSLNVLIRQPLPQMVSFTGRLEALADFRNLLAQGYVPITSADGRRVILLQNVRSFRGGLSFNF